MEYKLLGTYKEKNIYFPIDNNNKILLLSGEQDTGKSIMLRILEKYYNDQNIPAILFTPYQKLNIPKEELEGIICLFKLWDRNYNFHSDCFDYLIANSDCEINMVPEQFKKIFVILNVFYLTTINKYSYILIDNLYSKYFSDISYLMGHCDVKFIFSTQDDLINASNVIDIKQCIRDN